MSTQELETKGKVILKTSHGDLEIELYSLAIPLACQNFVQLCLDGYYDGQKFYFVEENKRIFTGDPQNTRPIPGHLTETRSFQGPRVGFRDEIHSSLRFTRRGLVGMYGLDGKHSNTSVFFLTLSAMPELNSKHTIFGTINSPTVFNLKKIGELPVKQDQFITQVTILSTTIVNNPFPNLTRSQYATDVSKTSHTAPKKKSKSLLSFDDEVDSPNPFAAEVPVLSFKDMKAAKKSKKGPKDETSQQQQLDEQFNTPTILLSTLPPSALVRTQSTSLLAKGDESLPQLPQSTSASTTILQQSQPLLTTIKSSSPSSNDPLLSYVALNRSIFKKRGERDVSTTSNIKNARALLSQINFAPIVDKLIIDNQETAAQRLQEEENKKLELERMQQETETMLKAQEEAELEQRNVINTNKQHNFDDYDDEPAFDQNDLDSNSATNDHDEEEVAIISRQREEMKRQGFIIDEDDDGDDFYNNNDNLKQTYDNKVELITQFPPLSMSHTYDEPILTDTAASIRPNQNDDSTSSSHQVHHSERSPTRYHSSSHSHYREDKTESRSRLDLENRLYTEHEDSSRHARDRNHTGNHNLDRKDQRDRSRDYDRESNRDKHRHFDDKHDKQHNRDYDRNRERRRHHDDDQDCKPTDRLNKDDKYRHRDHLNQDDNHKSHRDRDNHHDKNLTNKREEKQ